MSCFGTARGASRSRVLLAPIILACAGLLQAGCAETPVPEPPRPFSFVVLTDTHLSTAAFNEQRLANLVKWINGAAAERGLELALVLGDIGWGAGLPKARELLDGLAIPWVPLTGDNEVHHGDEADYERVFASQLARLATLPGWTKTATPVTDPSTAKAAWLVNFAFDHRGVRFVALDWASRAGEGLEGEQGVAHDHAGGTWPWFEQQLAALASRPRNGIVLLSHIPMHEGTLVQPLVEKLRATLPPHAERIFANLAGHVHINYETAIDGLFQVYATASTWGTERALRIFRVQQTPAGFEYAQELVGVPF